MSNGEISGSKEAGLGEIWGLWGEFSGSAQILTLPSRFSSLFSEPGDYQLAHWQVGSSLPWLEAWYHYLPGWQFVLPSFPTKPLFLIPHRPGMLVTHPIVSPVTFHVFQQNVWRGIVQTDGAKIHLQREELLSGHRVLKSSPREDTSSWIRRCLRAPWREEGLRETGGCAHRTKDAARGSLLFLLDFITALKPASSIV